MKSGNILHTTRHNTAGRIICAVNIILVSLSFLALLKSIFISFDIDEGYAIAQSYRLLKGDRLFAQMWEPHQLSAFFSSLFTKFFPLRYVF